MAEPGLLASGVPRWRLGHRDSLDALRGVAVLLVLAGHFGMPGLAAGGSVGVSLFFVLSGYLITGLLVGEHAETGRIDLRAFYIRRARWLLPALSILLCMVGTSMIVSGDLGSWLPDAASVALYVGNWWWLMGHDLTGVAHTWSLAVEEQFYILWPATLLVLGRRSVPGALSIVALSFLVTMLLIGDYDRAMYGSDARVKDLLLGATVALVSVRRGADLRVPTSAALLSVLILAIVASNVLKVAAPLLTSVPCAVLVAWVAARPNLGSWRPLIFTGRISYGLYLYHFPLEAGPFAVFDGLDLWPRMIALFVTSYALAIASWYLIERRFLVRRRVVQVAAPRAVGPGTLSNQGSVISARRSR
jgi:peptidoglycan/LPS O-acetylase OafA/YrhL